MTVSRNDSEFKAPVALEALKSIKTIQQIAKEYEVHPVQVSNGEISEILSKN